MKIENDEAQKNSMDLKSEINTFAREIEVVRKEWGIYNQRRSARNHVQQRYEFISRELQVLNNLQQLLASARRSLEELR